MRANRALGGAIVLLVLGGASVGWASDDLAARRLEIEKMTPAEQQDLLRRQERFATLPTEEQRRLRELQTALDADPHAKQLQQVLKQYHEWLKTLSSSQRAELADLGPADRVAQIKQIMQQQEAARQQFRRAELLSPKDAQEIVRWIEDILWAHRERLVAQMSPQRREAFEHFELPRQRRALLYFAYQQARRTGSGGALNVVQQSDIDRLAEELSPGAKEALNQAQGLPAERRIVGGWIGPALHRLETQQAVRKVAPWVDDEIVRFFQNELKRPERERLLKMPREQMVAELRKMYFERERPDVDMPTGPGPPARFRDMQSGDRFKGPRKSGQPDVSTDKEPKTESEPKP